MWKSALYKWPLCYQVLRIRDPEGKAVIDSVFKDDGHFLGAATVAVYTKDNRKLYIGTMDGDMAVCDVNYPMENWTKCQF